MKKGQEGKMRETLSDLSLTEKSRKKEICKNPHKAHSAYAESEHSYRGAQKKKWRKGN